MREGRGEREIFSSCLPLSPLLSIYFTYPGISANNLNKVMSSGEVLRLRVNVELDVKAEMGEVGAEEDMGEVGAEEETGETGGETGGEVGGDVMPRGMGGLAVL